MNQLGRFLVSLLACASLAVAVTPSAASIDSSIESSSSISSVVSQEALHRVSDELAQQLHRQLLTTATTSVTTGDNLRHLQSTAEDFDEFRELFKRITVWLPDFETSQQILFADLNLKARNIKCFNIVLGKMDINYNMTSAQMLEFLVDINDLDLKCTLDYEWTYSFFNGAGVATIDLNDNTAKTKLVFESDDYALHPPKSSRMESCDADITITDMSFTGTVTDAVLNAFEGLLRGYVQDAVKDAACVELGALGTELVQDMIDRAAELLEPYLLPLEPWQTNATIAEDNMTLPTDISLMNFQDEGEDQTWFYSALQEVDAALGVWLIDPNAPPERNGRDLGVNIFLRENILDDNRALEMSVDDFPFEFEPVIFQGHDEFTETKITIDVIRVFGLDTFSYFAPFINQGKYTLQNFLSWDFLTFEVDTTIDMKPSTLGEASILESTHEDSDIHIVEKVRMRFGVENVNATMSALLAIDSDAFGKLKLGSLMWTENILPCFWSSVYQSEVTVLEANIGKIGIPSFDGFISPGIDAVVTQSAMAAFEMYESVVIRAMPNIFQTSVKDLLNEVFFRTYDEECPGVKDTPGLIDFRDLLLSPEESTAMGASGTAPYGTLATSAFNFIKTQLATIEEDGTLSANDMFIRVMTEQQSGVEGMLHLPGDLFSLSASDIDWAGFDILLSGFKLALSDVQMINLDTMVPPFRVLEPTEHPHELDNEIHFGPVANRPLNVSAMFSLSFGEGSPYHMKNDVLISMSSSAFEALARVVARVEAMSLLNFPIDDLLNLSCWLATVLAPTLNELGFRVDPTEEAGVSLAEFSNKFQDLGVAVECTSCTTHGLNLLPSILELLSETDVTSIMAARLRFLVDDVVVSESFQTFLDRLVNDAAAQCPHKPQYTEDADSIGKNYADLPVPTLSETSIDTVQFVIATTIQVGFVVFTQLYSETEVNPQDALVEQRAFTIPEGSDLVNFTDFSLNLPSYLDTALDEFLAMLSGTRVDPVTGKEDLSVNIFIREMFGADGVFQWDLEGVSFGPQDLAIDFHSLRIEGLDTFTRFEVGVPVAPQTLANDLAMRNLVLKLDFDIRSAEASKRLQVAFGFDDLSASLPLFAAIDKNILRSLQVGSLLRLPNFLPCFFSAIYGFSFPHMIVNVGSIHKPAVVGLMDETDASLTTLVDTLFERYEATMHSSLPSVFDNAFRPLLNSLFAFMISENGEGCSNPLLDSLSISRRLMKAAGAPFMDFRDLFLPEALSKDIGGHGDSRYGDLIRSVWSLIESEILDVSPSGESRINTDVIGPLTEGGNLYFPGDYINEYIKLDFGPVPTGIKLRVADLRIENIDTFGNPLSLLDPVQDRPNLINNTATVGVGEPLRFGVKIVVDVSNEGGKIRNDFEVSASLHSTTALLAALMKVSEYRFAAFPLGDIFNLDCWLATMPPPAMDVYGVRQDGVNQSAAVDQLLLTMKQIDLGIDCKECSSPGFQKLADLWATPEASRDMTNAANDFLAYMGDVLSGGLIQNAIDRSLNDAAKRCPHSPDFKPSFTEMSYQKFETDIPETDTSLAIILMIVGGSFVVALAVFVFIIRFFVRRRHGHWLKTLPNSQLMLLKQRQEKEEAKEAELNATTESMFTSSDIPFLVRWIIPVIIIGNVGFFLSGHLSLGAEVKMQISIAGQTLQIDEFYQFSLARSTVEIWEAGGKELASLILIFSGIWPYTKQLITLVLWFLPTSRCSISRRGSILLWLDTLAKWSIVDIFTLIMSVAAFRVSVQSPKLGFLPDDLYAFDLLVVPMWGLYANLIAQLISQVSSHFIIHYHRNIVHKATIAYKEKNHLVAFSQRFVELTEHSETSDESNDCPYGDRKDLLNSHAFSRPHRGEAGKLHTRGFVNILVVFGAVVFSGLIVAGCTLPSTGLEFLGILGIAVESGQDWQEASTKLSLFDLVTLLMDQAKFLDEMKDYLGMGLLSALLIITVLIVPLAQTAVLMYQWFVPMAGRKRKHMAILVEILQAWQYMEVYVISVIVATWQLGPISVFMINSYCYTFQETFNQLSYFGLLESEDAQCFRVDASIESASYILLGAALLLALLNTFVMNAVKQYFRDRDEVISTSEIKEEALRELEAVRKPEQPALEYEDPTEIDGAKAEGDAASEYWDGRKDAESYIKPVPVLFSDKFRWVLRRATPKEELNQGPPLPSPQEMISTVKSGSTEHASDDESPTNNRARRTSGSGSFIRNVNVNLADEVERMEGSNSASTSVAKGRRHRLPSDGDETEV